MSDLVKVRLLNDGMFYGMDKVRFPAVVSGLIVGCNAIISPDELIRVGGRSGAFKAGSEWHFFIGTECEIIND